MDVAILSVVEIKTAPTGEACGHQPWFFDEFAFGFFGF